MKLEGEGRKYRLGLEKEGGGGREGLPVGGSMREIGLTLIMKGEKEGFWEVGMT